MTGSKDESDFCVLVKFHTTSTFFFLREINGLDVATLDFGNSYIHVFTKEMIYTFSVPEFDEW